MRTLIISDLHAPFHHPHALDFLRDAAKALKPDSIICSGDEVDCHNFARWQRGADAVGPVEELSAAKAVLSQLAKLFPAMTICESNHTWRPWKKAAVAGLLPSMLRDRQQVFSTPDGWLWAQFIRKDNITYCHGEGFSGDRAAIDAAKSCFGSAVIGHIHAHAGVKWYRGNGPPVFGLNVGCLIDTKSVAFDYAKHNKAKAILGCGIIVDGVPSFIPLGDK